MLLFPAFQRIDLLNYGLAVVHCFGHQALVLSRKSLSLEIACWRSLASCDPFGVLASGSFRLPSERFCFDSHSSPNSAQRRVCPCELEAQLSEAPVWYGEHKFTVWTAVSLRASRLHTLDFKGSIAE